MKYVGSKAKISKYIVPIIQEYIDKSEKKIYIEPFIGGANVIDKISAKTKIGNDIDSMLINLHIKAVEDPNSLNELPKFVSKELYDDVKYNKDKYEEFYQGCIMFFASYNARPYGGNYGAFAKTKYGKIRNYYEEALKNYKKQIPKLKDIIFTNRDYKDIQGLESGGFIIYCDPPYSEGIKYKNKFDHNEFWDWCRKHSKNNVVLISEYNAPDDFECIWSMPVKIHMNNRNKLDKIEKLFIYKGEKNDR